MKFQNPKPKFQRNSKRSNSKGEKAIVRKPTKAVYAVIRLDSWLDSSTQGGDTPRSSIEVTVKEILSSRAEAEAEVERLNRINSSKGCRYFWQQTRFVLTPECSQ
jgi:hypothetical protein